MAERNVVAVVVTYNSAQWVPGLLASLPRAMEGLSWELVVVDNHSSDGTVETLKHCAPDATLVQLGRNAGYGAGVNAGSKAAVSSDALLVLNPDVVLASRSVERLDEALRADKVGIAVPRIVDSAGRLSLSLRREPTVRRCLGEALLGGRRAGRFPALGETLVDLRSYDLPVTADWASGAVMLISRECLEKVGPWDESLWLYSEETDFCLRARDEGFELRYVPSALATHLGGEAQTDPALWTTLALNKVRLYRRRHGLAHTAAFWTAAVAGEALRTLAGRATHTAALAGLVRDRSDLIRGRADGGRRAENRGPE